MPDPQQPQDVTSQFPPGSVPTPPIRTMIAQDVVMDGAEDTSYLGRPADDEKNLTTKSVTITRHTDMVLDLIANDSRFGYESKAEVIRHAIEMLVGYYEENKAFLREHQNFASDILRQQHELRLDAERAKIRQDFRENITAHDDELDRSREIGDWAHVAHRLARWREMLRTCESETQRQVLRETLAGSLATRSAVIAFYRWVHDPHRVPANVWDDSWTELSEGWARFYEEMA